MELRARRHSETLGLARAAAARAGVTRVSDVTAFAVPGIPVFQATRPDARSLSVSQGKGLTPAAAIIGALLESVANQLKEVSVIEKPANMEGRFLSTILAPGHAKTVVTTREAAPVGREE